MHGQCTVECTPMSMNPGVETAVSNFCNDICMGLKFEGQSPGFQVFHFSSRVTFCKLISLLIPSFLISDMRITILPSQEGSKAYIKKACKTLSVVPQ